MNPWGGTKDEAIVLILQVYLPKLVMKNLDIDIFAKSQIILVLFEERKNK